MPFASDAIGVLVDDLSTGEHEIVVSWESSDFGFAGSLTYLITVTKK